MLISDLQFCEIAFEATSIVGGTFAEAQAEAFAKAQANVYTAALTVTNAVTYTAFLSAP